MRQERVQRARKTLGLSARQYTSDELNKLTDKRIADAVKASKRARKLLRSLGTI